MNPEYKSIFRRGIRDQVLDLQSNSYGAFELDEIAMSYAQFRECFDECPELLRVLEQYRVVLKLDTDDSRTYFDLRYHHRPL